ncbi:hypothetical protein B0H19DRAFT_1245341 [Mycena capillaripes]|nr:hypothetical protein B0H19DRAFT_1245341 [Mycena capillaripes]
MSRFGEGYSGDSIIRLCYLRTMAIFAAAKYAGGVHGDCPLHYPLSIWMLLCMEEALSCKQAPTTTPFQSSSFLGLQARVPSCTHSHRSPSFLSLTILSPTQVVLANGSVAAVLGRVKLSHCAVLLPLRPSQLPAPTSFVDSSTRSLSYLPEPTTTTD